MRPTTLEQFLALCEAEHDVECVDGAGCSERDLHIKRAYLPGRLADAVDAERARVRELETKLAQAESVLRDGAIHATYIRQAALDALSEVPR